MKIIYVTDLPFWTFKFLFFFFIKSTSNAGISIYAILTYLSLDVCRSILIKNKISGPKGTRYL